MILICRVIPDGSPRARQLQVKYVMKHTSDGRDSGVLPHYRFLGSKNLVS